MSDPRPCSSESWRTTPRRLAAALAVLLLAAFVALDGHAARADAPPATPDVAITLVSDAREVATGDAITYTAVVTNKGEAFGARVVLEPPAYVTLETVEQDGTLGEGDATWSLALAAGETTTLEATATVGEIPADAARATALISLYVGDETSPLVRSASADIIAGVDDEQTVATASVPPYAMIGGVGAALVVGIVAVVVLTRRRRGSADAGPAAPAPDAGSDGPAVGPADQAAGSDGPAAAPAYLAVGPADAPQDGGSADVPAGRAGPAADPAVGSTDTAEARPAG